MPLKRIFLSFIAALIVITPSFAGDIISCDSFEMCADGNPPLTNYMLELEAKVADLEAKIVARKPILAGIDMTGDWSMRAQTAYLPYADLHETTWAYFPLNASSSFAHANLTSAKFNFVDFYRVSLTNANLTYATILNSYMSEMDLTDADLTDAELNTVQLSDSDLTNANLTNTTFTSVIWSNVTCPDGSNSDTNGLNACVALDP